MRQPVNRLLGQGLLVATFLLSLGPAVVLGQNVAPTSAGPSALPDLSKSPPFTMPPAPPPPAPVVPAALGDAPACEAPVCVAPPAYVKWLENLSVLGGLNGAKKPEDLGVNAHFGYRIAVNAGLPLWEEAGLGFQVGTGVNQSDNAVGVFSLLGAPTKQTQCFTSVGLFQRTNWGLNWGAVYDFRYEEYYGDFWFGQVRGQVGYQLTKTDEVGVWGTLRTQSELVLNTAGDPLLLRPINQVNLFYKHVWGEQQVTRVWVGMAEGHGSYLLLAPGEGPVKHPVTFGADVHFPLSDYLAVVGEAQFITPNDTGTVTAMLGIAFYPLGGARRAGTNRFAPMLPLANNPSFAVDLRQP